MDSSLTYCTGKGQLSSQLGPGPLGLRLRYLSTVAYLRAEIMIMYSYQRYTLIGITLILSLAACGEPSENTNAAKADSMAKATVAVQPVLSRADSIDKDNAATIASEEPEVQKAMLTMEDSAINIVVNKYRDHRIFGYKKPDTGSQRMILFSIFTNDVETNPFQCPYGAYYENSGPDSYNLKFVSEEGGYMKVLLMKEEQPVDTVYVQKKWVEVQ